MFTVGSWLRAGLQTGLPAGGEQGSGASLCVFPSSGGFELEMRTPASYSIDSRLRMSADSP